MWVGLRPWNLVLLMITLLALGVDWLNSVDEAHQLHHQIYLKQKLVNAYNVEKNTSNLKMDRSWLSELPFKMQFYQRHGDVLILHGQGDFLSLIAWLADPANLAINDRIQQINLSKLPSSEHLTIRLKLSKRQWLSQ